ncbi:AcrR family transcriptional regulator [Microbacterium phyllosphaerae]|uniref:AcrR family transcriptional regulator n=1 Tax=Microbacterium phyllosphaerae TaxID=124798 RepID=A0ABS4WR51_9MICO|nr:TetR/AcrR family transcriptional regulator [Microbacterium phyllosphaerae]MBP2378603.1 AcrR family transcriptional regulator [Microbacterium phyllosphaerae]
MSSTSRAGRPKASSRETLAEAACELFLERGYDATSVADITQRAGVSRSSFFNYFSSKSDVLWSGLDDRISSAVGDLITVPEDRDGVEVRRILSALVAGFAPDSLALAMTNSSAMGLDDELEQDAALRQARLSAALADLARRSGVAALTADIAAATWAAAVLAAVRAWAESGAGRGSVGDTFTEAVRAIDRLPWSGERSDV